MLVVTNIHTFGNRNTFPSMSTNSETLEQLDYLLSKLVRKYPEGDDNSIMTDISFQAKADTGELILFDDDDETIATTVVPDWIGYNEENFSEIVSATLKKYLSDHKEEMEKLSILHPFSFLLVDDDKETINELYEVDDEAIVINHEDLMKGLNEDLNSFIKKLLSE